MSRFGIENIDVLDVFNGIDVDVDDIDLIDVIDF